MSLGPYNFVNCMKWGFGWAKLHLSKKCFNAWGSINIFSLYRVTWTKEYFKTRAFFLQKYLSKKLFRFHHLCDTTSTSLLRSREQHFFLCQERNNFPSHLFFFTFLAPLSRDGRKHSQLARDKKQSFLSFSGPVKVDFLLPQAHVTL